MATVQQNEHVIFGRYLKISGIQLDLKMGADGFEVCMYVSIFFSSTSTALWDKPFPPNLFVYQARGVL